MEAGSAPAAPAGGTSIEESLLANSAIDYWQSRGTSAHLLGPGHAQSVHARERLAAAYAAGRVTESMSVFEAALTDREATFGPQHPETLSARVNLAHSCRPPG